MLIDVGNLRLPREILGKPGPLSAEEMEKVREHPALGMEMLLQSGEPPPHAAIEAVYTHHERMDGSGYPRGLSGNDIPLYGRMVAIVDVYDAATSDRTYRHGHPPSDALRDLYNCRKGQFDERLVEQFIQCLGIYPVGSVLRCSTGELGIVIAQNPQRRLRPKLLLVRDPEGRPFPTPKILDLSKFGEEQTIGVAGIVDASHYGIDVAEYLGDLSWLPPARDSKSDPDPQ
jgi:HD-GYP domain-containing protein (c-di-GMP phosphodiesterase class II)